MTFTSTGRLGRADTVGWSALAILTWLEIWLDRRWPGSLSATLVGYAFTTSFLALFGAKIWIGIRRRKPHWTGESWRRYVRLAAMPVGAAIVFMALVYLNDVRPGLFGTARSAVRALSAVVDVTLLLVGAVGFGMAVSWMERGEPSEQFTRTRWFRRRGASAIAD